jgi:hypothetical protein
MDYIGSSTEARQENGAMERKLSHEENVEPIYFSSSFIIPPPHPPHPFQII